MKSDSEDAVVFMQRALDLARQGQYSARPNPCVGCVIVNDNKIVGEGTHWQAGQAHAEVEACLQAETRARGATAYVTLEPCVHLGRTGPCVDVLRKAGIKHVVMAMLDPNPLVAGKGLEALERAGMSVSLGVLAEQAQALNKGFISRMTHARPYVRAKIAMSLDGRIALKNGESQWITGEAARESGHYWRARSGAVITGAQTVLADNCKMTVRLPALPLPPSVSFRAPLRVIVDGQGRVPATAAILSQPGQAVVATVSEISGADINAQVIRLPEKNGHVDLNSLLAWLAEREINDVLLESGAGLTSAFYQENLIDELLLYIAPVFLGPDARAMIHFPELTHLAQASRGSLDKIQRLGEDLHTILAVSDFAKQWRTEHEQY